MKHCKVEVYLLEFKLSLHSQPNEVKTKQFSRASSVGRSEGTCTWHKLTSTVCVAELEQELKETFSVDKDSECRVWHRYMTNTYELLNNSSQTLQDAGLYNGQVRKT